MSRILEKKAILIFLLILLNLVLRIPWTPHEIGWDSFTVHSSTNSISAFGEARWLIHPASIVGLYPYSYASALPFFLSGMSQTMGIDTETTILFYNLIMSLLSIFFAYIMAGIIWDNDIFKFFVAFIFSTSQGIVTFSTWTANARTLFVILLPLFIYVLLKTRRNKLRFSLLTLIMLALLATTHRYISFVIPILVSYFGVVALYFLYKTIKKIRPIKIPENFISIFLLGAFLIMFIVPFLTRTFIEVDPSGGSSRYAWMFVLIKSYTRYIGIPIVFVIGGYTYLLLKKRKKFGEIFLLVSLAAIAPFLYVETYMKWFIITFASLLIGMGLTNVTKPMPIEIKKYRSYFIIIFLTFSMVFVSYYQFLHFLNDQSPRTRYMEESTYEAASWIKDSVDKNVISQGYITNRLLSISEVPLLSGFSPSDLAYGFVDSKKLEVEQIFKPTEIRFYIDDPYKAVNIKGTDWMAYNIVYKQWARRLISQFNISYYVENKDMPTELDLLVRTSDERVYDNGKIKIWDVGG